MKKKRKTFITASYAIVLISSIASMLGIGETITYIYGVLLAIWLYLTA